MSSITIVPIVGDALYHRYRGQTSPVYVQLACDTGQLTAFYSGEIGSGVPSHVWHQRTLRWKIPALTEGAANTLLGEIEPEAERIKEGYERVWDGHNHVGQYDNDATDAIEAVASLCDREWSEGEVIEVWDASDWYGALGGREAQARDLGITSTTTDDEITGIAEREENNASPRVIEGLRRHLEWLRETAEDAV